MECVEECSHAHAFHAVETGDCENWDADRVTGICELRAGALNLIGMCKKREQ